MATTLTLCLISAFCFLIWPRVAALGLLQRLHIIPKPARQLLRQLVGLRSAGVDLRLGTRGRLSVLALRLLIEDLSFPKALIRHPIDHGDGKRRELVSLALRLRDSLAPHPVSRLLFRLVGPHHQVC